MTHRTLDRSVVPGCRCRAGIRYALVMMAFVGLAGWSTCGWAVLIYVRGSERPVGGFVMRNEPDVIVLRIRGAGGAWQEKSFRKQDLDDIVETVSKDRLGRLRAGSPEDYRDYAEELSAKRVDPEAHDMAIRLFVIAAYLEPVRLGQSSLLALVDLARNTTEARRFQALAFVNGFGNERRSIEIKVPSMPENESRAVERSSPLLLALRQLRRGDRDAARRNIERAVSRGELETLQTHLTADELFQICQENLISDASFRKVLALELQLMAGSIDSASSSSGAESISNLWSRQVAGGRDRRVAELSLEQATEFDPELCEFRDGKWSKRRVATP